MGSSNILKTLLYSDIFDYPLKKEEIWKYLISSKKIDKDFFDKYLKKGNKRIGFKNNFYYLKDKTEIISKRLTREKYSLLKIKEAKKIIKKLSFIPSIYFIGISGSLSLKNAEKEEDIDLFIITAKNTLWFTRLIMVLFLLFLGKYRKRNDKEVSNKICLNFLIDESVLSFSGKNRDLYTAHEIVQLMPIFERKNTYKKFIKENGWTERFLPNAFENMNFDFKDIDRNNSLNLLISHFEKIAQRMQVWYMKKHKTTEIITNNYMAFHPFDHKKFALKTYSKKLKDYRI